MSVCQNPRMAVSLVHRRIRRQAIEIALAFDVVDPNAFGALDDDVERMIVVSAKLLFEFDEFLSVGGFELRT